MLLTSLLFGCILACIVLGVVLDGPLSGLRFLVRVPLQAGLVLVGTVGFKNMMAKIFGVVDDVGEKFCESNLAV